MKQINVLIADDHRMFRQGIIALLEKEKEIKVVCEASAADEIFKGLNEHHIDVILMDLDMGETSGITETEKIVRDYPEVRVLALSMHCEHNYILKMLEAGAKGYILKNTGKEEMITAIKTIAGGDSYFTSEVSSILIQCLTQQNTVRHGSRQENIPLTIRELEVLKLIAREYSNPEIAKELFISIRTVDTHRRNLLEKLGLKNTAGLVKYAISKGLLD